MYSDGGRKFAFLGLDSLGCAPGMRFENIVQKLGEGCHENSTKLANLFNTMLIQLLHKFAKEQKGFKFAYLDSYTLMKSIVSNPSKYGTKSILFPPTLLRTNNNNLIFMMSNPVSLLYIYIYDELMIINLGLKEAITACCGSREYRGNPSCGGRRKRFGKYFQVCQNPHEYVFFDGGHFSEETHKIHANAFWNGTTTITGSYTVEKLFKS